MEWDWYWICSIPGIYRRDIQYLLQHFGTAGAVRNASVKELTEIPFLKTEQKNSLVYQKMHFSEEEEYHRCKRAGIRFVSFEEDSYPKKLLQIEDYPYGLYVKGELPQEEQRCIAIVGARMCTNYGRQMAQILSARLAEHQVAVISGMAYGIDGISHGTSLEHGGKSYGVLGSGVDICYPREHYELYHQMIKCGGVLSEYPMGTRALPSHFPQRNRIISGMADIIVVVEAKKKSGSLITADLALDQGRDVYVFPGRVGDPLSEGCNRLIAQGAGVISDIDSFLSEIGIADAKMKKKKKTNNVLATAENMVYSCVDSQTRSLQNISDALNMPVSQVISALGSLQMKGLVLETAKNHYTRNIS